MLGLLSEGIFDGVDPTLTRIVTLVAMGRGDRQLKRESARGQRLRRVLSSYYLHDVRPIFEHDFEFISIILWIRTHGHVGDLADETWVTSTDRGERF